MTISLDTLRRWPDLEGPDLHAVDAADRLILDESAPARDVFSPHEIVVIGDNYGALTLGAAKAAPRSDGRRIRVHQDPLTGERALATNAANAGFDAFQSLPLSPDLVRDARVVLMRLPRALEALRDIAGLVAAHASPDVVVFAGGRIKHMTLAMNEVLREHFYTVDVTHARQKSRVLIARGPHNGRDPVPRRAAHDGITVCAYGGAFAGASIDIGTRFLLENLPAETPIDGTVIDFACGTGIVATTLALRHSELEVYACDQSYAAVASARETARANSVDQRINVVRDDMLASQTAGSASFIALNPPFHVGAALSEHIAPRMFEDAARVLRPGGELRVVWNSPLQYRAALERIVGPTRQIARNSKFTVTSSLKR
ncbi:class I SAM-dependent methyltransferase [Microbacterium sp. C7(2022)]|uniref:class I SAM-dependent methyltransferase n=1 Tax=Microbacterium sp. C7(2022) TaxID=2992759 RepID=UPI00237A4A21|nr:class I SAM-dependent methyltransferase [Microbacterium sp. C7(2022)]MDE0547050.1 methyltransferase [Microbacterium sp. C7(2022)]